MGKQNYREVTSLMGSEACVLSTTVCYFESWLTCTEPVARFSLSPSKHRSYFHFMEAVTKSSIEELADDLHSC